MTGSTSSHSAVSYRCNGGELLSELPAGVTGWTEALPYLSDSAMATAYRDRFLLRPFSPATAPLRVGLARYRDGQSDLMLAASAGSPLPELNQVLATGARLAGLGDAATPAAAGRVHRSRAELPAQWDAAELRPAIEAAIAGYHYLYSDGTLDWELVGEPTAVEESELASAGLRRLGSHQPLGMDQLRFSTEASTGGQTDLVCSYPESPRLSGQDIAAILGSCVRGLTDVPSADEQPGRVGHQPTGSSAQPERCPMAAERIDELVATAARQHPAAIAVRYPGGQLSYQDLMDRSAGLAARLIEHGVRRGDLVGINLARGEQLVVSMLAVMRAGAAYIPLDPTYPAERLAFIADDAQVTAVITESAEEQAGWLRIDPRVAGPGAPHPALTARQLSAGPTDAAYVIYTSGSTGRPKGVVVEHRNFAALLAATRDNFALGSSDVWTMFHSYSFDFSVWEIWGCLATGGRLVILPAELTTLPQEFRQLLHDEAVTVLNQTPSAFTQLLSTESAQALSLSVRLLIFGGEKLDARALLGWFDRHPERECRVVNMYGITETTVHSSWIELRRNHALAQTHSVGQALPGWTLLVLDEAGQLVPAGGFGEIYVGGGGVSRGYLNRPALTADRFLPDPFSGLAGSRLYRSGDRGRLRPDGTIEHHGRLDSQVKVRGYRIELDEIGNRIRELPGVTAATVVLNQRGEDADVHLDAYLVGAVDGERIAQQLAALLPAYMVPSSVTVIDSLPLTHNGKFDPSRLPAPVPGGRSKPVRESLDTPDAATGDDGLLRQVSDIWQRVLGVQPAPEDNFFLIGGNSLLAIRVINRLREAGIGQNVSVRLVYEHPTVNELASALAG